ncbi:MAG: TAXI family TRAP transporter solute-binding subunit [Alphaproteobacteria bacterium]
MAAFRPFPHGRSGEIGITRRDFAQGAAVTAALCLVPGAAWSADTAYLRIATGPVSGTYFAIGGLIASAVSSPTGAELCQGRADCPASGLVLVAQSTNGSSENVDLIMSGAMESGLVQADVAYWRYMGQWTYRGLKPARTLRLVASLFTEAIHVVVRKDAKIQSIEDLRGKRVSFGAVGSGTELDARVILGGAGLTEQDVAAWRLSPAGAVDEFVKGNIDAMIVVAGPPAAWLSELFSTAASRGPAIAVIPIEGNVAQRIQAAYPFYGPAVIPADAYPGVKATATLGVSALWLVSATVKEETVYAITRALWDEKARADLDGGHPQGRKIQLRDALRGRLLPLHPGAERYYREKGLIAG